MANGLLNLGMPRGAQVPERVREIRRTDKTPSTQRLIRMLTKRMLAAC